MGCWSLMQLSAIPKLWIFGLGIILSFGLGGWFRNARWWGKVWVFVGCCFLGLFWQGWHCTGLLGKVLGIDEEGMEKVLVGRVCDIPVCDEAHCSFSFVVDSEGRKFRLSWYGLERAVHVGESWKLFVRLKRVHGSLNPGGFDSEAWSWQQHFSGKGYVINKAKNEYLGVSSGYGFLRWREGMLQSCKKVLHDDPLGGIVTALNLGWTQDIPYFQKVIAQRTGTAHLLAISGLHVGMVAGLVFWLLCGLWSKIPRVTELIPSPVIGALFAIFAAIIYSEMAGFACSTQRACVMCAILLLPKFAHRHITVKTALFRAVWVVLLWDPCVVLSSGFWLSFGAVFVLVYAKYYKVFDIDNVTSVFQKMAHKKIKECIQLLQTQWICLIGLLPLSCWYFHQVSLVSLVSNLIAIPLMGVLILPLVLLGTALVNTNVYLAKLFFTCATKCLAILGLSLQWLSQQQWAVWNYSFTHAWEVVVVFSGCALLVFSQKNWRWVGLVGLVPLALPNTFPVQVGQFKLSVLDVGQGLATVVSTRNHTVIYDTGAKFSPQLDCGQQIVVPYLIKEKIRLIDTLVLSHGDNDHAGGASAILKSFTVKKIYTSAVEKINQQLNEQASTVNIAECVRGISWKWDGVKFEFLHPDANVEGKANDRSCVLKVSSDYGSVLFTGDIEKTAERWLTQQHPEQLSSSIMIVPHHGSKTSSIRDFLDAVHPKVAILSYGYRNRYRHPNKEVVERYLKNGSRLFNTVSSGAISYTIGGDWEWQHYRARHREFWRPT